MPIYDKEFGQKLKAIEKAVGFRFPPSDFQNAFLAKLLDTTPETMSRKKKGGRRVTEGDWSRLTDYFDLGTYGFAPSMFGEDLGNFQEQMDNLGRLALKAAKPNEARQQLYELAIGPHGGEMEIIRAERRHRGGGIGAPAGGRGHTLLRIGDDVKVKIVAPMDGYLVLLNDAPGYEATCLMPSHFAPDIAVRQGQIILPTARESPYFPVGGPARAYRLYAIWFATRPDLAALSTKREEKEPLSLSALEFVELAAMVFAESARDKAITVAMADYEVQ